MWYRWLKKDMKIWIIGAGFVGSTTAYAIIMQKLASKVVIVDINEEKAKAEALDIAHSTAFIEDMMESMEIIHPLVIRI